MYFLIISKENNNITNFKIQLRRYRYKLKVKGKEKEQKLWIFAGAYRLIL